MMIPVSKWSKAFDPGINLSVKAKEITNGAI
jgi:hypothetical protein